MARFLVPQEKQKNFSIPSWMNWKCQRSFLNSGMLSFEVTPKRMCLWPNQNWPASRILKIFPTCLIWKNYHKCLGRLSRPWKKPSLKRSKRDGDAITSFRSWGIGWWESAFRKYAESSSRYTVYLLYPPVSQLEEMIQFTKTVHYAVETSRL